ncbi:ribokinase [Streptomyces sp. NPDC059477]|uniref:ribokinase n=1 Tax=Streptomyces sp. NPDC059477 TaxID=3346847 RepID=UPI003682DC61
MAGNLIVVGSANQDYVLAVDALPTGGETRLAHSLRRFPGGKGANQAVAAARLGAQVAIVGAVGDDDDGALLIRELRAEGVDTSEIEITSADRTGLAVVSLLPAGESAQTVVPGANHTLSAARTAHVVSRLATPDAILVVQAEIPADVVTAVVRAASQSAVRSVVNLSPVIDLDEDVLRHADPLVVHGVEAAALTGFAIDGRERAEEAAAALLRIARSVVVVADRDGAAWADDGGSGYVLSPRVGPAVDTTGAGDAFVGGLVTLLAEGASLKEAVRVGAEVGAVAMSRVGAQASYPYRRDIRQLRR